MNARRVEKMLPVAMRLIDSNKTGFFTDPASKTVDSRYRGYIDSYGPTIRQTSLLTAIMYYRKNDERKKVNNLILNILKDCGIIDGSANDLYSVIESKLRGDSSPIRNRWKSVVIDAVIAAKLAVRTFKINRVENNAG